MRTPLPFISDTLPDIIILQNKCKKNSNHPQHKHLLEPFKMEVSGSYLFSVLEKQPKRVLVSYDLCQLFFTSCLSIREKSPLSLLILSTNFFTFSNEGMLMNPADFLKKLKNAFIIRSINVMKLHGNSTYHLLKSKNFKVLKFFGSHWFILSLQVFNRS